MQVTPGSTRQAPRLFPPVVQVRDENFYRIAGFNAYRLGLTSFDCPYKGGDKRNQQWFLGYAEAKRTTASPMLCEPQQQPKPKAQVQGVRKYWAQRRPA
jgi:hypothetical protein